MPCDEALTLKKELDYYATEFSRSGVHGPCMLSRIPVSKGGSANLRQ